VEVATLSTTYEISKLSTKILDNLVIYELLMLQQPPVLSFIQQTATYVDAVISYGKITTIILALCQQLPCLLLLF
jgi:hypothetical protein